MTNDEADKVKKKLFKSLRNRYKNNFELKLKVLSLSLHM